MQNGMQNRIAIIPEENKSEQRKTKGEMAKNPLIIYIYIYLIIRSPLWDFRCIFLGFYRDPVDPVVFRVGGRLPIFLNFAVFFGAQKLRHFWNFFIFLEFYQSIAFFKTSILKSKRDAQDRYISIRFQTLENKRKTPKNSPENSRLF